MGGFFVLGLGWFLFLASDSARFFLTREALLLIVF